MPSKTTIPNNIFVSRARSHDYKAEVKTDIAFLEHLLVRLDSVGNCNLNPQAELDSNENITQSYKGVLDRNDSEKLKRLKNKNRQANRNWDYSTKIEPVYNRNYLQLVEERTCLLKQVTSKLSSLNIRI